MLPDLTPAAARALEAAQCLALARGAAEVQPTDLLHGMVSEEEGRPALVLAQAGADLAALRQPTPEEVGSAEPIPLARTTEAVLFRARELAHDLAAEGSVNTESLLLALVRNDEPARQKLEAAGVTVARLEAVLTPSPPVLELDEPLHLDEPAERQDTARAMDAAANRAREALRVAEDYCRFVLDDRLLTGQLKALRHDLAAALEFLPDSFLLAARDTPGDVGTTLTTEREQARHSLRQVAHVNLKRLQEALRSLEEFAKLADRRAAQALEQLRYRAYTLERAILLGSDARRRLADARLYVLLTGKLCAAALDWTIAEAAAGGATIFQLREKDLDDRALLARARQVRRWTRQAGAIFIVNDRPDISRLADADGVHLGQDDLPVREARRVLGPDALVGVSTHSLAQLRQAVLDGASYVGVGPTFASVTKDFAEFPGPDYVRQATAETSLPAFVIGGMNPDTIAAAVAAGARRVAVSQAVCAADDPRAAAAALLHALPP